MDLYSWPSVSFRIFLCPELRYWNKDLLKLTYLQFWFLAGKHFNIWAWFRDRSQFLLSMFSWGNLYNCLFPWHVRLRVPSACTSVHDWRGGTRFPLYTAFFPHPFDWSDQSHLNNTLACFSAQLLTITQGLVTEPQESLPRHPSYCRDCFLTHVARTF